MQTDAKLKRASPVEFQDEDFVANDLCVANHDTVLRLSAIGLLLKACYSIANGKEFGLENKQIQ